MFFFPTRILNNFVGTFQRNFVFNDLSHPVTPSVVNFYFSKSICTKFKSGYKFTSHVLRQFKFKINHSRLNIEINKTGHFRTADKKRALN